jgi:hypothetical protein
MRDADRPTKPDAKKHPAGWRVSRRNLAAGVTVLASALVARSGKAEASWLLDLIKRLIPRPGDNRCFLRGTRILTPRGEVEISTLKVGDLVITYSGEAKPIKWIGRSCHTRPASGDWPNDVLPVRVKQFALSETTPHRDLYLSRSHALYIDGLLVPVGDLVNGRTIAVAEPKELSEIAYYHLELAGHEVVFAEGAPSETLLETSTVSEFDIRAGRPLWDAATACAAIVPFAPLASFNGGRAELRSRLRSALSPILDRRTSLDVIRDRLEDRAEERLAA